MKAGDFKKSGSVHIDVGASRDATLHIGCSSDRPGGAIVIELIVPDAYTKKDFGYEDFEGPDAPAGALSHLEWTTAMRGTSITTRVAGSYIPDPPDAFQFGLDVMSHQKSAGATFLANVTGDAGKLVWTQSSYDKSKRTLVASFDIDAAESQRIHDLLAPCLPDAAKHTR